MTERQQQPRKHPASNTDKSPNLASTEQPWVVPLRRSAGTLHPNHILHLQRTLGNQAVLQLLRRQPLAGRRIQREPVETRFGTFADEQYDVVDSDSLRGLNVKLTFAPNKRVNAEKIGMMQSVKSYKAGEPIVLDPTQKDRMVEDGDAAGFKLDTLAGDNNPVYGSAPLEEGDDLTDTPETDAPGKEVGDGEESALYQLGYRYRDSGGDLQTQNAAMHDKPVLSDPPPNSGQEFETTALALSGNDKDTYYGSVRWGWQTDGEGNFVKLPLTKVSDAIPSANFLEAAKLWNEFSYEAKVTPPDRDGIAEVKAPITLTISESPVVVAAGSKLKIDVKGEVIGGKILIELQEPIQIADGQSYWVGWVPTANIADGKLTAEATLEKDGKPFKVAAGATIESTGHVVGEDTLVYVKQGTILSADFGHRFAWVNDYDVFGRETADLPIPSKRGALRGWSEWATDSED